MIRRPYARTVRAIGVELIARIAGRRPPDFVVGADDPAGAYLRRWYVIPRNRFFNIYLHSFLRPDDDRALHDHPWHWASLMLLGSYLEITEAGQRVRTPGSIAVRGPRSLHRVALFMSTDGFIPAWTLFITGPRVRDWGFLCPNIGWVPWQKFTKGDKPGEIGPGCDQ